MQGTGYCECGCGQKTELAPRTYSGIGWVKGQPIRFIFGHQNRRPGPDYIINKNGCWIWQRQTRMGYGRIRNPDGSYTPVHRLNYERKYGPVPDGLELDHVCHTLDLDCPGGDACYHRGCVNPDHMEPVTHAENARRGRRPPMRTHCKKCGAEFTPENTIEERGPGRGRRCRACHNARVVQRYHRRKAAN